MPRFEFRSQNGFETIVRQLAQSSLKTEESIRSLGDRHGKDKAELYTAMNGVVATVKTKFDEVNTKVDGVASKVDSVDSKVERLEQQNVSVLSKVERLEQQNVSVLEQAAKKDVQDKQFLSPLASMFNTKTGFVAYMPVQYTNKHNTTYNVVVMSMPNIVWFNKIGRPDGHHTEMETRSYFTADKAIGLHTEIPYGDFCSILEKTPFRPRAVLQNESWNRLNFVMVTKNEFKRVERQNEEDYVNRPRTLPLIPKAKQGFTHLGNSVAYTQGAPGDLSSGFIPAFQRSFTMEEKALVPAMGRTWTTEVLDTSAVRDLFGITEEQRGKYHIVGGKLEAATIKTHAEVHRENSPTIKAAMERRLMRAKARKLSQAGCSNKKRKR